MDQDKKEFTTMISSINDIGVALKPCLNQPNTLKEGEQYWCGPNCECGAVYGVGCQKCGKPFIGVTSWQKFCSDSCRVMAHKKVKKTEEINKDLKCQAEMLDNEYLFSYLHLISHDNESYGVFSNIGRYDSFGESALAIALETLDLIPTEEGFLDPLRNTSGRIIIMVPTMSLYFGALKTVGLPIVDGVGEGRYEVIYNPHLCKDMRSRNTWYVMYEPVPYPTIDINQLSRNIVRMEKI